MTTVSALPSIDAFAPIEWNRLLPREREDHAYLRATERAGLAGFRYLYFAVREDDRLVAVVPAFVTDYRLDTTMQGGVRRTARALARMLPRLLRIPMLSLGSPVTERCRIGFAPDSAPEQRVAWLDAILARMEDIAAQERLGMLAVKDAPLAEPLWQRICPRHGLRALPGLPGATLAIRWRNLDGYLDSLGAATRKDLRRKRRAGENLRIEWRANLDGIADDVQRLYRETRARAVFVRGIDAGVFRQRAAGDARSRVLRDLQRGRTIARLQPGVARCRMPARQVPRHGPRGGRPLQPLPCELA
jgi:hypothetical protein